MSAAWIVVIVVSLATIAIKGAGPLLAGGRELPRAVAGVVSLLAPAVLAALSRTPWRAAVTSSSTRARRALAPLRSRSPSARRSS